MELAKPSDWRHYMDFTKSMGEKLKPDDLRAALRWYCENDLYFLLRVMCNRKDMGNDWCFARCREVESAPDGYLDLWARDHYKSTIITFGGGIQAILNDPTVTIGIFSHTRPLAKAFMRQIKQELEGNDRLKALYPDILWQNPQKEAPKWSEDDGLIVKRSSNPKEATIEAWGLVDGQPIGKHFFLRVYDDVVTPASVNTPDMIEKTNSAFEMSLNLGTKGGRMRVIGTRYHFNDTYKLITDREIAVPRTWPAMVDGKPVFLTADELETKRRQMGPYTYASQMLLDPVADDAQGFKREWLRYYEGDPEEVRKGMNVYIRVDPANEKKRTSDYTTMVVVGLGPDRKRYILDWVRDRLNPTERINRLFFLVAKWKPILVTYEKYGIQADIHFIQKEQANRNFRFRVEPISERVRKEDRIRRLIPEFEKGDILLPERGIHRVDYEGKSRDLVAAFINDEYSAFPVAVHDDMLDGLAQETCPDNHPMWPEAHFENYGADGKPERYKPKTRSGPASWRGV